MIVARVRTPVALGELAGALDAAHRDMRGTSLGDDAYAIVVAQLRLEHGTEAGPAGESLRGIFCFNFGNHDATGAERNDPAATLFETVPEHEVDVHGRGYLQVHVRRAYPDVESGLMGYWRALLDSFPGAYEVLEAESPTPEAFAAALKAGRYYTASEQAYARDLRALLASSEAN